MPIDELTASDVLAQIPMVTRKSLPSDDSNEQLQDYMTCLTAQDSISTYGESYPESNGDATLHEKSEPFIVSITELRKLAAKTKEKKMPAPEIHDHTAVAMWHFQNCEGACVMCLQSLMKLCPSCEASENEDRCSVSIGICKHPIHSHCFERFDSKETCLVCRQTWLVTEQLYLN